MPPRRRKGDPVPVTTAAPKKTPAPLARPDAPAPAAVEPPAVEQSPAKKSGTYKQRSVYLPDHLWERARAAIAYVQYFEQEGEPDTLAALIGQSLEAKLDQMEADYNKGEPFKKVRRLSTGPGRAGVKRLTTGASDEG